MIAVKNWFLEKNHLRGWHGKEITIVKETEKAVLAKATFQNGFRTITSENWIPKSCIIDEWEKDTSNFGYKEYLESIYHKAYESGMIENFTIKSGRNTYRGDNFIHQMKTKEIIDALSKRNIQFMTREEWNNRKEA